MGRKPCCDRVGLKKGSWTAEEDRKLINFILLNGHCCWRAVPKLAGLLRCGKSCRLRWINYLRPDLKRGLLSDAEEQIVINLHSKLGNRWSKIAGHLPGRTDNEIKNHWNTHIKKKLKKIGIDPQTHKPISPNVDQKQVQDSKEEEEEGYNPSSSSVTDQSPSSYEEEQEITKSNPISSMDLEEYSYSELLLDEIPGFTIDEVPMIQPHEITTITSTISSSSSSFSYSSLSNLDCRNYSNQLNSPIMEWDENSSFWGFDDFNELDQLLRFDSFLHY